VPAGRGSLTKGDSRIRESPSKSGAQIPTPIGIEITINRVGTLTAGKGAVTEMILSRHLRSLRRSSQRIFAIVD
jgi:hypothetical protein